MIPYFKISFNNSEQNIATVNFNTKKEMIDFLKSTDRLFYAMFYVYNINGSGLVKKLYESTKLLNIKDKKIVCQIREITLRDKNLDIILGK